MPPVPLFDSTRPCVSDPQAPGPTPAAAAPVDRPSASKPDAVVVNRRLSVAPMLDWTDRHDRWFLRRLTRRTLLYTEMVVAQALTHADPARFLDHDPCERPLALQLGGSDPDVLYAAARLARPFGFCELNLNVGCPSDRVSQGRFGACLMAEPALVADCLAALGEGFGQPATVKHRIGIDNQDSYDHLTRFVDTLDRAGTRTIIVHARKAWLSGLSPKENREIPPLRPEIVRRLKADFPHLTICHNGGVTSLDAVPAFLAPCGLEDGRQAPGLDGVMIGRAAYETPALLAAADRLVFGDDTAPIPNRHAVALSLEPYLERLVARGEPVTRLTRHILGLFHGCPGARSWRRVLSEEAPRAPFDPGILRRALATVPQAAAPSSPQAAAPGPAANTGAHPGR